MKKKHTHASSEVKKTVENNLTVVAYIDIEKQYDYAYRLISATAENESVSLILVTSLLVQNKQIELAERVKIIPREAAAFSNALSELKTHWVLLTDPGSPFDYTKAITYFTENKSLFKGNSIYAGELERTKGISLSERFGNSTFNFFTQLFLPSPVRDYSHRYYFFSTAVAENSFTNASASVYEWLCQASYRNADTRFFTLPSTYRQKAIHPYRTVLKLLFATRFKWFVTGALAEIRNKTTTKAQPVWRLLFAFLFLFLLFLMPVLSLDFGSHWDEKRHNDYGKMAMHYFTSFGHDTSCLSESSGMEEFRFYGEQMSTIAAFLYTYVKLFDEYDTRHILISLYAVIAMLFAGLSAKLIGGWRTGVFALVFMFLSPVFLGHAMNNSTDIPFVAGCTIYLYYFLKILQRLPSPKTSDLFMCGVGISIAVGARAGGGAVLYFYTALFIMIAWIVHVKKHKLKATLKTAWPYIIIVFTIILCGHLLSLLLWPYGQHHPFTAEYNAFQKTTDPKFGFLIYELFNGIQTCAKHYPWYQASKMFAISTPLFVLAGSVFLILASFILKKVYPKSVWMIPVIVFVLLFPALYAEYKHVYHYNGWRHFLFLLPPFVMLSALGWDTLIRVTNSKAVQYGIGIILFIGMLNPVIWIFRSHPNECVYYNELVGGIKGAYGNYELDYAGHSCRKAGEWIANHEPKDKPLIVGVNNEPQTASLYMQRINPNIQTLYVNEFLEQKPYWDYLILTTRTFTKKELRNGSFPPKGTVYTVDIDGVPVVAVVKRGDMNMVLGYKAVEVNKVDSAVYYFSKAVQYNDKDEEAWRMYGNALMNSGKLDSAEHMILKSMQINSENYLSYYSLGLIYFDKRDFYRALQAFNQSIKLRENRSEPRYFAAMVYLNTNDYPNAIKQLNAIVDLGFSLPSVYYSLGVSYNALDDTEKAIQNYQKALSLDQGFKEAWVGLANVYGKLGRTSDAEYCMERFKALGG